MGECDHEWEEGHFESRCPKCGVGFEHCKLKKANDDDWDFILKLRNENYNFFYHQTGPISKEKHYEYLKKQNTNPAFFHWIILYKDEKVGYVRILHSDVSIMVLDEYKNKGIGTHVLELLDKKVIELRVKKLIGLIYVDNKSSQKIFEKNGYKHIMNWYQKDFT